MDDGAEGETLNKVRSISELNWIFYKIQFKISQPDKGRHDVGGVVGDVVGDMGEDVVKIGRDEIAGERTEVGEGSVEPGGEGEVVG